MQCVLASTQNIDPYTTRHNSQVDANATSGQLTPLPLLLPLAARSEEALKKLATAYGDMLIGSVDGLGGL